MSSPVWRRRRRGVRARIARRHAARIEALFAPHMTSGEAFLAWEAPFIERVRELAEHYRHGWEHAYRQRWIAAVPADDIENYQPAERDQLWMLPNEGASITFAVQDELTPYLEAIHEQLAELAVRLRPAASEDEPSGH